MALGYGHICVLPNSSAGALRSNKTARIQSISTSKVGSST